MTTLGETARFGLRSLPFVAIPTIALYMALHGRSPGTHETGDRGRRQIPWSASVHAFWSLVRACERDHVPGTEIQRWNPIHCVAVITWLTQQE